MEWATIGWFSHILRPYLDDITYIAYKASMHNVVSNRNTYKFKSFDECLAYGKMVATAGSNDILIWVIEYLKENYPSFAPIESQGLQLIFAAVDGGQLEAVQTILKMYESNPTVVKRIAEYSASSMDRASANGRIKILKWIFESLHFNDVSIVHNMAASTGNIECMQFIYDEVNRDVGYMSELRDIYYRNMGQAMISAIEGGHLDCVTNLYDNGCEIPATATYFAAIHRRLDCYVFLRQTGAIFSNRVMLIARSNGWP